MEKNLINGTKLKDLLSIKGENRNIQIYKKKFMKSMSPYCFYLLSILMAYIGVGCSFVSCSSFLDKDRHNPYLCTNGNTMLRISEDESDALLYLERNEDSGLISITQLNNLSLKTSNGWESLGKLTFCEYAENKWSYKSKLSGSGNTIRFEINRVDSNGFNIVAKGLEQHGIIAVKGNWRLNPIEQIYGFGETWNGHLGQRGQRLTLWNKGGTPDECAYMPYWVSTRNYGLFLRYGGLVRVDIGRLDTEKIAFEVEGPSFDLTLFSAENIAGSVKTFAKITGLPNVPPRWSFKPWFWLMSTPDNPRGSIRDLKAHHTIDMVKRLKKMDIPVGVTWFEPPWQTNRTSFIADNKFSNDLKKDIETLNTLDVRTLAWTVPYTTKGAKNWEEAINKGYLVRKPETEKPLINEIVHITASGELEGTYYNSIDFYNPKAFSWWQDQIGKALNLEFQGFKLDAGQDIPEDAVLHDQLKGKDIHNSYARLYNQVFWETLNKRIPNDFLTVSRAAWIGSAPFTVFKWPGDLSADFGNNGLSSSLYSSLSLALSGFPFVSTDIGGFENRPPNERVFIRWTQFGSMLPGMQTLNMPWWFSEGTQRHFRHLAWLHTSLTPYWMSLAKQAAQDGTPLCRPLVWDYQDEQESWYVDDQFTVGPFLLVAPIINGDFGRNVYLPKGRWIDFWDQDQVTEGPIIHKWHKGWDDSALHKFPLYLKEGSIIPLELTNNVTDLGWLSLDGYTTLAIWPQQEGRSSFDLNDQEKIYIETEKIDNQFTIALEGVWEKILFRIQIQKKQKPTLLVLDGKPIEKAISLTALKSSMSPIWFFQETTNILWLHLGSNQHGNHIKFEMKDHKKPVDD